MESKKKIIYIIIAIIAMIVIVVTSYFVWNNVNKPLVPTERPKTNMVTREENNIDMETPIESNVESDVETPAL